MNEAINNAFSPEQWVAIGRIYLVLAVVAIVAGVVRWRLDRRSR